MTERILDVSREPARLAVRNRSLLLQSDGREATIPFGDIAAVSVSHPCVTFTRAALAGLARAGCGFVVCDESSRPVGMLLPLDSHSIQTERLRRQAEVSLPTKKRLWKQLVSAKIRQQGRLLERLHGDERGLLDLAGKVRSGDKGNLEARASRRYWPALFQDRSFRRNPGLEDQNRYLNYGYAILRAAVARALCACGLHPSLGLHHHNRYNSFCLADDLVEPLRPLVDERACRLLGERGPDAPLDRPAKEMLLGIVDVRLEVAGESRQLFDAVARMCFSLVAALEGREKGLLIPEY